MAAPVDSTTYNYARDLLSPLGIGLLILYLGALITRLATYRSDQDKATRKILTFIDFFSLGLSSQINAYETLFTDLDERTRFQYKHISDLTKAVDGLKKLSEDVAIFSDEKLRESIINIVDQSSVLLNDINNLEVFEDNARNEYSATENSVFKELQDITLELLKMDIRVDTNTYEAQPLSSTTEISNEKKSEIKNIFSILNQKLNKSQADLDGRVSFCKDKRTTLSTRILDSKTKIASLNEQLSSLKIKTQKKRLFFF